jgi:hypothetical protein
VTAPCSANAAGEHSAFGAPLRRLEAAAFGDVESVTKHEQYQEPVADPIPAVLGGCSELVVPLGKNAFSVLYSKHSGQIRAE